MSDERVILVDDQDGECGTEDKLVAHERGLLHRALSVFLLDGKGRVLLQRRASGKYHSGGRWANTCCSHPRPGEDTPDAARRRLREEMGVECALTHAVTFTYRAEVGSGLIEHEIDHVFVGRFEGEPTPDPSEVEAWEWRGVTEVLLDCDSRPERYVVWLGGALHHLTSAGALEGNA